MAPTRTTTSRAAAARPSTESSIDGDVPIARSELVAIGAVTVLAFALRLVWGLAAGVTPEGGAMDDAWWYHRTALHFMHGHGYVNPYTLQPTALWPPGYPAVLAVAYRLLGPDTVAVVLLNAVAGALTCTLLWCLGRRLVGVRAALGAALLLACFPSHVFFVALTLSECLFALVATALVLAGTRGLVRATGPLGWMAWGIALGVLTLVRSEAVAWCVLPAAAVVGRSGVRRAAGVLAATVVGMALALTPWTIRNARVFDAFVPSNTGLGRTVWAGHNPNAGGGMTAADQRGIEAAMAAAGASLRTPAAELAANRLLVGQAVAFARTHPLRELALLPARCFHLFRGDRVWQVWYGPGRPRFLPTDADGRLLGRIGDAYYLVVGLLALAGWVVRGWPAAPAWRLFDGVVLLSVATFSATLGDPRYHFVLLPFACLMAAVALTRIAGRGAVAP